MQHIAYFCTSQVIFFFVLLALERCSVGLSAFLPGSWCVPRPSRCLRYERPRSVTQLQWAPRAASSQWGWCLKEEGRCSTFHLQSCAFILHFNFQLLLFFLLSFQLFSFLFCESFMSNPARSRSHIRGLYGRKRRMVSRCGRVLALAPERSRHTCVHAVLGTAWCDL